MLTTIILFICVLGAFFLWRKSCAALEMAEADGKKVRDAYFPVSRAEDKLKQIKEKYSDLQIKYNKTFSRLSDNKKKLSLYNLGVGTSDDTSYAFISETKEVRKIEAELAQVKEDLKEMVKNKTACICSMSKDVRVNGRKAGATKLFNREIKLRIRCLDNEFKAASSMVDWNNINRLSQRARETFDDINNSGRIVKTQLSESYFKLKNKELRLTYELNQIKADIKEEQREEALIAKEAEREEKRIIDAANKARKEREIMEKLVAHELSKLESSSDEQKELYELHKLELEVLKKKEVRAQSLAQQTRAGYVYIISNRVSFGGGMVKIGMTRRADPDERVKELGDASVPELFDVHAYIYSEDAPSLEKFLHNEFSKQRVNLVNHRKEFFKVDVQSVVKALDNYQEDYEIELEPHKDTDMLAVA